MGIYDSTLALGSLDFIARNAPKAAVPAPTIKYWVSSGTSGSKLQSVSPGFTVVASAPVPSPCSGGVAFPVPSSGLAASI